MKLQKFAATTALLVAVAALAGRAADERHPWEDTSVNAINRLPATPWLPPLPDARAALSDALEPETPFVKSLNGVWKFAWVGDPARRSQDFWKVDFDDSRWGTIDVPSRS